MGKACVLCEWFLFKPKKYKEIQKKERKNPIKKNGDSEDFGIPFTLFFCYLNSSNSYIATIDLQNFLIYKQNFTSHLLTSRIYKSNSIIINHHLQ
jgi:hypothetical protein